MLRARQRNANRWCEPGWRRACGQTLPSRGLCQARQRFGRACQLFEAMSVITIAPRSLKITALRLASIDIFDRLFILMYTIRRCISGCRIGLRISARTNRH